MAQILDLGHALPADRPFTTAQARDLGVSDRQLFRLVELGWLRRPVRGVYAAASLQDTLAMRCETLRLVVPEDAFICDHTAAWLHAGDRALAPNDHLGTPTLACFRRGDGGPRIRRASIRSGERSVADSDLTVVDGLLVTTPLRTALDLGRLARSHDVRLHAMDTMLSIGSFAHEQLLAEVPRFAGERGVVALRVLAPLADAGSESFGESALRLRWHEAGLPRPQTQIEVTRPGGSSYWIDMGLPETKLGAEYDGEEFHSSVEDRQHDHDRRSWLAREHWTIEEFRRAHVFGPQQDAEQRLRRVHEAMERGQRRRFYL